MYYQIYDTQSKKVIVTSPTLEEAQSFLRLYDVKERVHLKIRAVFKLEHPLRRGSFGRY